MKRLHFIIIGITFIIVAICMSVYAYTKAHEYNATGDEKTAEDYIKSKGYKIVGRKGEIEKYILDKDKFKGITEDTPYIEAWSLQMVEPENYFGKEIITYGFIVKNHPLQKITKSAKKGVKLFIMLSGGKVIGGFSGPNAEITGGPYSLDGKTLEELTGLTYKEWAEKWKEKYGDQ